MSVDDAPAPIRLVLHPGHDKCGSSSIQAALYAAVDSLAREGVYLPDRRFRFPFDAEDYRQHLGNPLHEFDRLAETGQFAAFDERLGRVAEAVADAGGHTIVVSAENLADEAGISAKAPIHELFAKHFQTVDVVTYIRRQDDWTVSSWQQTSHKLGWTIDYQVGRNLEEHRPDFLGATRFFERVYGRERVQVVPLHRRALRGGDLLVDFSRRTGIGLLDDAGEAPRRNRSLSGFLCEVLSRAPGLFEGYSDQSVKRLLLRSVVDRDLLLNGDKRVLTRDLRRRIQRHFEADNRALHREYFPKVPFDLLFGAPGPSDEEELQELQDHVDGLTDVVAIQMELIVKLLRERESAPSGLRERVRAWTRRWARGP